MEHIATVRCTKCNNGGDTVPVKVNGGEFEEFIELPKCDNCGNEDLNNFEILTIDRQ
jgi:NAD-dependent SIR2 family protein deacetylase